ncbi:ribose 5-phosphate isomerase B [Adhaeribacter pallidiroseus]|uniref:Ribose-5-phosphate isomerase n=1 Tax=Adhaeribacter pallidiroseus TaxID=2072847 RepID=A0A369QU94_9BACT|nr:ribose 5-phosphate isomerase B [Adhaeribacter pallidiroseus]RDC65738.1 Ribose-5-phosphate isomerase [Adhaeribacter pallidiroseus]
MALTIAVGGDHAGYAYKQNIINLLQQLGHTVQDFGPNSSASVDYPDHVHPLAKAITNKEADFGILICGSGNGVAITANKHPQVRAALCWLPELAQLARSHNNANVLCIPARFISEETAHEMVQEFLITLFEGGRHQTRVSKMTC